jgi:hypothetical protein
VLDVDEGTARRKQFAQLRLALDERELAQVVVAEGEEVEDARARTVSGAEAPLVGQGAPP